MDIDALDAALVGLERSLLDAQAAYRRRAERPPPAPEARREDKRLLAAIDARGVALLGLL
jgi:hypothetical protein